MRADRGKILATYSVQDRRVSFGQHMLGFCHQACLCRSPETGRVLGFGGNEGHDAHVLYTLSGLQAPQNHAKIQMWCSRFFEASLFCLPFLNFVDA